MTPVAEGVRTITLNGEKQKIVLEFTVKNGTKGQSCDNIRPFFRIGKNTEVTIENYRVSVSAAAPVKTAGKNHWQHITAVYDHDAAAIYIDGKLVVSATIKHNEKFLASGMDLVSRAFRNESDLNKLSGELLVMKDISYPQGTSTTKPNIFWYGDAETYTN